MGLRELQNKLMYEIEKTDEEIAQRKSDMNKSLKQIEIGRSIRKSYIKKRIEMWKKEKEEKKNKKRKK